MSLPNPSGSFFSPGGERPHCAPVETVSPGEKAFEEMFAHMLALTRIYGQSVFQQESDAGRRFNEYLVEKRAEIKARVLS